MLLLPKRHLPNRRPIPSCCLPPFSAPVLEKHSSGCSDRASREQKGMQRSWSTLCKQSFLEHICIRDRKARKLSSASSSALGRWTPLAIFNEKDTIQTPDLEKRIPVRRRSDAEAETPILWPPDLKNWNWKRPWCWARLNSGEAEDRGWDGCIASPIRWTWVWKGSEGCWWTGKPGVLQSMGLQRVGYDWATELNWEGGGERRQRKVHSEVSKKKIHSDFSKEKSNLVPFIWT